MDRSVAEAIRQQSEDLREELKDLEQWEDAVRAKEAAKAQRKTTQAAETAAVVPPIRGTVPSLKEAVRQQQAAKSSSSDAAKTSGDPIQEAKDRGNAFFQAGRLQEAVAAYTVGIDLDPASSTTHVLYANRAMCYLKLGQWTAAEKDATTCVQMNTGYAKAYYRRAMARKNLHKLQEARSDLEAVLALAPKDVSAQQEMAEVTKALQAQRAVAATTSGPTSVSAKKRIVIEEVDSEEDEEQGAAPAAEAPSLSSEEQQLRDARIDEDLKKLAAMRAQHETQVRLDAQREEQAQAQRQRRNQRVEIVEEDDDEAEAKEVSKEAPAVPPPPPAPSSQPAVSVSAPTSAPTAAPAPPAPAADTPAAPAPVISSAVSPSSSSSPVAPRPRPAVTKERLAAPKSFTEFERRFREVEQVPELRNYYVSLLNPAGLSKLFGSNMTPEILLGILESIKTFAGTTALQYAKGLCQVNRVEDMTFFFNAKEKAVVQDVLDVLTTSGAPSKDIQAVQRKLKPF